MNDLGHGHRDRALWSCSPPRGSTCVVIIGRSVRWVIGLLNRVLLPTQLSSASRVSFWEVIHPTATSWR